MKKLTLSIAALATALALNAQSGTHAQFKMTSARGMNGTMDLNYSETGHLSVMKSTSPQLPGGEMIIKSLYKKSTPDVTYMIDDKSKTYREQKKSATHKNHEEKEVTVKKVGEETVNGYKCVHAVVTEELGGTTDTWNTKDIPDYAKYEEALTDNRQMHSSKRMKALKDAGCEGFPVKMTRKGKNDADGFTMELVKFEKKSFSASDFEIPAGYTKTEAPAGGGYPGAAGMGVKSQEEIMKMTPEERQKYIEEMKKKYGK
ncbi:MAG: DUF4412 domain-containing protein [Bacteroidia bacterium]